MGDLKGCKTGKIALSFEFTEDMPTDISETSEKEDIDTTAIVKESGEEQESTAQNDNKVTSDLIDATEENKENNIKEQEGKTNEKGENESNKEIDFATVKEEKSGLIWADEVEREKDSNYDTYDINMEQAEQIVEDIVKKAEKVVDH